MEGGADMAQEKKQQKEDSVYLTQADIRLLSEYFWDMTGYTSRFGYFYLGSEKENVQGLTKWQGAYLPTDAYPSGDGR